MVIDGIKKLDGIMNIFTIGYEGSIQEDVIDTLLTWKIDILVDVRELPLSRKKGFSKTILSESLSVNGIGYYHSRSVGCPKEIRHQYRKSNNWDIYTKQYLEYLTHQNEELNSLFSLCQRHNVCLLCFEANPLRCHRNYVADSLAGLSDEVVNILHLSPESKEVVVPQLMEPVLLLR